MDRFLSLCGMPGQSGDTSHLLLCPFAGASAGAFRSWRDLRPVGMRVSLAIYPGRDHRMNEICMTSIDDLAIRVLEDIDAKGIDHRQLVLAGHSMGAQVAYEVCAHLERKGLAPRGLVLSGCHAPHLRGRRPIGHLEDRAFLERLVSIGGCPNELLNDHKLWSMFMPMLRADFLATESYQRVQTPETDRWLQTPTLLVYGVEDEEAWHREVDAWKAWISDVRGPVSIAGDHFYITRRPRAFLEHVRRCFEPSFAHAQTCASSK